MSNSAQVSFRPAVPGDADAAVPLILSSGPDAFAYVFASAARPASAFLRHAFVDGAGQFGYRNHVVGEVDRQVVAAGTGFGSAKTLPFLIAAVRQFFPYFGLAAAPAVIVRGLRTEAVIKPPGSGEFYIGQLGVDPAWRGRGIGEALLAHLLANGAAAGLQRAVLDVATTNPRAEALYTRLGFRVTAERPSTLRRTEGFVPSHRRMERPIGPDAGEK